MHNCRRRRLQTGSHARSDAPACSVKQPMMTSQWSPPARIMMTPARRGRYFIGQLRPKSRCRACACLFLLSRRAKTSRAPLPVCKCQAAKVDLRRWSWTCRCLSAPSGAAAAPLRLRSAPWWGSPPALSWAEHRSSLIARQKHKAECMVGINLLAHPGATSLINSCSYVKTPK